MKILTSSDAGTLRGELADRRHVQGRSNPRYTKGDRLFAAACLAFLFAAVAGLVTWLFHMSLLPIPLSAAAAFWWVWWMTGEDDHPESYVIIQQKVWTGEAPEKVTANRILHIYADGDSDGAGFFFSGQEDGE